MFTSIIILFFFLVYFFNITPDSVDFRLVNLIGEGDIVITQDYGLAAMCLSKQAVVLNQDGKQYTGENISGLLEFRAIGKKIRRSGGRTKGMPKRTMQQNLNFEKVGLR